MRYLNTVLFVLLALVAIRGWRRRRSPASGWVAAAFTSIAAVSALRFLADPGASVETPIWVQKSSLILLAAFPYFLYRFGRLLWSATDRWNTWATWLTAAVVAVTLAAPRLPGLDESWPVWTTAYAALLLCQWIALSGVTSFQMYTHATGQPAVVRKRMRMLSLASVLLSAGLISVVLLSAVDQTVASTTLLQPMAVVSALFFFAGFAPPAGLRRMWRRSEEERLQEAQLGLMAAQTPQEVCAQILPFVAGSLGGRGAALVDGNNALIGAHNVDPEAVDRAVARDETLAGPGEQTVRVSLSSGALIIGTSSYSPVFGSEELAQLESFGVMVDLALARCELIEAQRVAAEELVHTNEQLADARDAAMESSRLKGEFLATMSHEIRTPMNGVIGLTGLLLNTPMSELQRSYAEGVKGGGEALLAIIDNILDFSKIEADRMSLEVIEFDLRDVVNESVLLLAETARSKGLTLMVEVPDQVPRRVCGDAVRLRQILLNLVSNAIKFTETGEIWVRVGLESESDGAARVRFEVQDTGIGIAPEDHAKLFEPFSQVDSSTTRRFGGTGLGLAISRRLVQLAGGQIGVNAELDSGSTFWFALPFAKAPQPGAVAGGSAEHLVGPDVAPAPDALGKILVVEDDRINQMVAVATVEGLGYSVDVAADGAEALKRLSLMHYSAVLMDCQMPKMDGYETTRQIRLLQGPMSEVPVLAVTAGAMEGDKEKCLAAGMDDYISKPIRPEIVKAALGRWVSKQMAQP